jgi:hypothetical protein
MGLHANDPVIKVELSFSLFDDLVELLDGLFVRVLPSVEFDLDDSIKTLVLWEFSVEFPTIQFSS